MTPGQCRAARALLRWSQDELTRRCDGVSKKTIADFEREITRPRARTLQKLEHALSAAGITFLDDGAPGVRLPHQGNLPSER